MSPENQDLYNPQPAGASAEPARQEHGARRVVLGLIAGAALVVLGALISWRMLLENGIAQDNNEEAQAKPSHLFPGWDKPDLAIVVSGQAKGYLQPCGCSSPQYGGLARRYNFIKSLERRGWPVVAVDLGDLAQPPGTPHEQVLLKYSTAMHALRLMGYTGVGVGKSEFGLPLSDALAHYALNTNPPPWVLGANVLGYPGMLYPWAVAEKSSPRVGVTALITKSLRDQLNQDGNPEKFAANSLEVLHQALKDLGQKNVEFGVLLVHGRERRDPVKDPKDLSFEEAKTCAEEAAKLRQRNPNLAPVNVILWTAGADLAEPPAGPTTVGHTLLVTLGHKGKSIGVVGVFRNPNGGAPIMKYQLVSIGPEYETPEGQQNDNPVMTLMEDYAREVKRRDFMAKFSRTMHPVQVQFPAARYVGSETCGDCHEKAYNVWTQKPGHSEAYTTLVETAKRPSLRQFDGECVVCHTVGFEHKTGFYDSNNSPDNPKQAAKQNIALHHVGCESCHGPGSEHINLERLVAAPPVNPGVLKQREDMHRLMNKFKASRDERDPNVPAERRDLLREHRLLQIDIQLCQKCHDQDNDVHWNFAQKWPKIIHMTPSAK